MVQFSASLSLTRNVYTKTNNIKTNFKYLSLETYFLRGHVGNISPKKARFLIFQELIKSLAECSTELAGTIVTQGIELDDLGLSLVYKAFFTCLPSKKYVLPKSVPGPDVKFLYCYA